MARRMEIDSLAVMGGSFDPIHLGHLIIAERAAEALRADRVLFIPCNIPPHKKRSHPCGDSFLILNFQNV